MFTKDRIAIFTMLSFWLTSPHLYASNSTQSTKNGLVSIELYPQISLPPRISFSILDHPQVACILNQLINEEDIGEMRARLYNLGEGDLAPSDSNKDWVVSTGNVAYAPLNTEQGMLLVHPSGRIIGGYQYEPHGVIFFTNDPALKISPPDIVVDHMSDLTRCAEGNKVNISWIMPKDESPPVQDACSQKSLQKELAQFWDGVSGSQCNQAAFLASREEVLIKPSMGNKAYFYDTPIACKQAACPQRRKSFVIAGDVMENSGHSKDGFVCLRYPGTKDKTTGWIQQTDTVPLDIRNMPDRAWQHTETIGKKLLEVVQKKLPWEGRWGSSSLDSDDGLIIKHDSASDRLHASIFTSSGYRTGSMSCDLTIDGNYGYCADDDEMCQAIFLHFNNAIIVIDSGCSGVGVSSTYFINGSFMAPD